MSKQQKNDEQGRPPAETSTGSITAETRVKDFAPLQILEDLRTLQAIRGRLEEYSAAKEAEPDTWDKFSADAESAAEQLTRAIYDMSSLISRELDYCILNRTTA